MSDFDSSKYSKILLIARVHHLSYLRLVSTHSIVAFAGIGTLTAATILPHAARAFVTYYDANRV